MKENNPIFGIRGAFLRNGERKMRQVSINTIRRSPVDKLAVKTAVHSQVVEHIHDSLELAYVLEGSAKHFLRAEVYAVKKGDYFFVDFGTAHGYSGTEDFQVLNCMFLPELIEESLVGCTSFDQLLRVCLGRYHNQQMIQTPVNRIFTDGDGQILALLQGICREAESNRLGSREILRGKLLEIMILTTRKIVEGVYEAQKPVLSIPIDQAVSYFHGHLQEKSVLQQFCREHHYSVPYISSKFREELGCTAVQYLQRLRIEKSCKLLAASQQSIRQIAEAVGYENEKFFHKLFRRLMGMSPGAYRLRIRQADP